MDDPETTDANARLRAALQVSFDDAALSRAVRTRLSAAAPRRWRPGPGHALAAYAVLALAFGLGGYLGGGLLVPDSALDFALGSVSGVLQ